MVAVAVNVTDGVPHNILVEADIEIVGVTLPFTVMVMLLDVAVVVVAQVEFEVSTQVTIAPLVKVVDV